MQFSRAFLLLSMLAFVFSERTRPRIKEVNEREDPNSEVDTLHDFFIDDEDMDDSGSNRETEDEDETGESDDNPELGDNEDIDKKSRPSVTESSREDNDPGSRHFGDTGKCTKDQLSYFPHRLREWFSIIMQEIPRKTVQDEDIVLPLKEKDNSPADRKWVEAALWKFCDLDIKPHNRYLSRYELSVLRDPLVSMEPCIDPFLADCDANDDAQITLQEWGLCLGLEDDEIEDKCKTPKDLDLK